MKSICVLDEKNCDAALESFARKLIAALGSRVVLMSDEQPHTQLLAEKLKNNLAQAGGTVFCLKSAFESHIVSVSRLLEADGAVYLYCDPVCRMSVYGANGRHLTNEEEQKIARAEPGFAARPGYAVALAQSGSYTALAMKTGETFENVAVSFSSPNASLLRFVRQTAFALGAVERKKPHFFISRSGLNAAAEDERGRFHTREMLLNLCCACELSEKKALDVPFSAALSLEETARRSGAELRKSFAGGCEPWQTDGVMLVFRVLCYMSKSGLSLSSLFDRWTFPAERRTVLAFDGSLDRLADRIPCEEAVAQSGEMLFIRRPDAGAVLTRQKNGRRCCLEVQAFDAETAQALCEELEQAVLTY